MDACTLTHHRKNDDSSQRKFWLLLIHHRKKYADSLYTGMLFDSSETFVDSYWQETYWLITEKPIDSPYRDVCDSITIQRRLWLNHHRERGVCWLTIDRSLLTIVILCWVSHWGSSFWMMLSVTPSGEAWHSMRNLPWDGIISSLNVNNRINEANKIHNVM
jgi:hypothetical protein